MAEPVMAHRWRPSPLIKVSIGFHALAVPLLLAGFWPTALVLLALNHLVLTLQGLWPRSTGLGPNVLRLNEATDFVALTLDDGPDPHITPQVLAILDAYGAKASFFCLGESALAHPELVARIVASGHRIENHSMRHPHHFSLMGPAAQLREVKAAQAALTQCSGARPHYFRAPAGLRNPFLDWVLHQQGLRLASWTRRGFDTRETDPQRVLSRLLKNLAPGDILLLHDRHSAMTTQGHAVVLTVLPSLLKELARRNIRCLALPVPPEG